MKIKILVFFLVFLFALPLTAAPPKGKSGGDMALSIDNTTIIDANRVMMFVTNHGNFGRDLAGYFGYDYGTFFPFSDTVTIRRGLDVRSPYYAGGLWIGAIDSATGERRVIIAEYSDEYVPGPMVNGTFVEDNADFHVYKLYGDSLEDNPNADYLNWPVDQGAPVDDEGRPAMIGDQMCWSVFNDADATAHTNSSGETAPLGLEVRQTIFAFDRQGSLGNMVLLRMRVYNKGGNTLRNCYFSIWSDPDLGGAGDDLVGCDTTLGLGFVYNATNDDQQYEEAPPCLGIDFFQGPLIEGTAADTAFMWGDTIPGYYNMPMTSFNKYINGTDPDNAQETYNYMTGLNRDGSPYVYNNDTLKFFVSGDPVAGTGDLDIAEADRRYMMSTGPITFRPGDSTEILAAIIVGQGADRLTSITAMKNLDAFAQRLYESGFNPPKPPAAPQVHVTELPGEIVLSWNDLSETQPGDYEFEGYTVWQGESRSGPWTELVTYDLVNDRTEALIDTLIDDYSGLPLPVAVRALENAGLTYRYRATQDALLGSALYDATDYYFQVTAFAYSTEFQGRPVPAGDKFLESATVVTVQPQAPRAGVHLWTDTYDTVPVTHMGKSDGSYTSDGAVYPLVIDPYLITGNSYKVDFTEDAGGVFWNLYNTTTGDTIFSHQMNQSGDEEYQIVDGLLMKILGPPVAGNDWDYTVPDPVNISPVVAAEKPDYAGNDRWFTGVSDGELVYGGVYLEPNFWGETTVTPDQVKKVEVRFRPMASYTDLNGDGVYSIGEPYTVDDPAETSTAFAYTWGDPPYFLYTMNVPFTAWDVEDAENPRQLNIVVRDRDQNGQWDLHNLTAPSDPLLPNDGDQQYNYVWILDSDYDATGTMYGDGTGGTIDFFDGDWIRVIDGMWCMWLGLRGDTRGPLAEECTLTLIPNYINTANDTFTFSTASFVTTATSAEEDLDAIKAVPNPFYLSGNYDPNPGSKEIRFHHLPDKCTITIYNLAGDLIRVIDKDDASSAVAAWDVLTENGLPVASGIYIYVVEAPGFGTKIGKMAVFTEAEVLDLY